jgi:glutamate synthase domain-containing protein 2
MTTYSRLHLFLDVLSACLFFISVVNLQGADFEALYIDLKRFHSAAMFDYDSDNGKKRAQASPPPLIPNPGNFNYRDGGEAHLNTPSNMLALQKAARENSREAYKHYSQLMDSQTAKVLVLKVVMVVVDDQGVLFAVGEKMQNSREDEIVQHSTTDLCRLRL